MSGVMRIYTESVLLVACVVCTLTTACAKSHEDNEEQSAERRVWVPIKVNLERAWPPKPVPPDFLSTEIYFEATRRDLVPPAPAVKVDSAPSSALSCGQAFLYALWDGDRERCSELLLCPDKESQGAIPCDFEEDEFLTTVERCTTGVEDPAFTAIYAIGETDCLEYDSVRVGGNERSSQALLSIVRRPSGEYGILKGRANPYEAFFCTSARGARVLRSLDALPAGDFPYVAFDIYDEAMPEDRQLRLLLKAALPEKAGALGYAVNLYRDACNEIHAAGEPSAEQSEAWTRFLDMLSSESRTNIENQLVEDSEDGLSRWVARLYSRFPPDLRLIVDARPLAFLVASEPGGSLLVGRWVAGGPEDLRFTNILHSAAWDTFFMKPAVQAGFRKIISALEEE